MAACQAAIHASDRNGGKRKHELLKAVALLVARSPSMHKTIIGVQLCVALFAPLLADGGLGDNVSNGGFEGDLSG